MRTITIILALAVSVGLAACGDLDGGPRLVGERDGKVLWNLSGATCNQPGCIERDATKYANYFCKADSDSSASIISTKEIPGPPGTLATHWTALYTCTK
ncbi:hypothetical protein FHW79_006516 [Azospirillum sp. OGB3]|uniref:hypothetical protein n=1 Tax=Azospirillum sp. OGB3 TaxID=2587012 RepID=UPI00160595A7|nr:hypothetical protein [Azospirillum sp. OGB3]MBB3268840.1 hypothetical protein [Azospirillum sp. OGB3]